MFEIKKIPDKTIDEINNLLNTINLKETLAPTMTVGGFQSQNIYNMFSKKLLKKILPINGFYKKIYHIHYIKYNQDGYQKEHNHAHKEKYSFILYLNNSSGDTVFKEPINKRITPELGKLIFFKSDVFHRGEITNSTKKILVGGIAKDVV
tara:strand:- start:474 stop:923 length:450 start_codon:yes stop_codon:yes gene_type:complete